MNVANADPYLVAYVSGKLAVALLQTQVALEQFSIAGLSPEREVKLYAALNCLHIHSSRQYRAAMLEQAGLLRHAGDQAQRLQVAAHIAVERARMRLGIAVQSTAHALSRYAVDARDSHPKEALVAFAAAANDALRHDTDAGNVLAEYCLAQLAQRRNPFTAAIALIGNHLAMTRVQIGGETWARTLRSDLAAHRAAVTLALSQPVTAQPLETSPCDSVDFLSLERQGDTLTVRFISHGLPVTAQISLAATNTASHALKTISETMGQPLTLHIFEHDTGETIALPMRGMNRDDLLALIVR